MSKKRKASDVNFEDSGEEDGFDSCELVHGDVVEVGPSKAKKKAQLMMEINMSVHEAALAKLPVHVKSVYDFAYGLANIAASNLQPDGQHIKFFDLLLSKNVFGIFLTGIPGSGKSTIINLAKQYLQHQIATLLQPETINTIKMRIGISPGVKLKPIDAARYMVVATAPTGAAANSITDAITFDSLFSGCDLMNGRFESLEDLPKGLAGKIKTIRVFIIDELSMIHPYKFANGDAIFRLVHEEPNKFFGGVRVIMSGDFHQLKPVFDQKDDITVAMRLLRKDAVAKNVYPLVFDTASWLKHESGFRFVQLSRSFRQEASQLEFMDLLQHVRDDSCTDAHKKMLASRVMSYEDFCESTNLEVTPVFKKRESDGRGGANDSVNGFNEERLQKLPGTEYVYLTALIASPKTAKEVGQLFAAHVQGDYLSNLYQDQPSDPTYSYGPILDKSFARRSNPVSLHCADAIDIPNLTTDTFSGFYFEKNIVPTPDVLRLVQEQKGHLGRANFLTRLKIGAKISLTKNLSLKDGLLNGSSGTVVQFMTIASFMKAEGTKNQNGVYISKKSDPRETATTSDPNDFTFRRCWGLVDQKTCDSSNEAEEFFPLIMMEPKCKTKFLLLTPVLTEVKVTTDSRQKANERQLKQYMSRSLANNHQQGSTASKMSTMDTTEHLALISQSRRNILVDHGTKSGIKIFALHMPVALAWATTIYSIQGLTVQALWLGDCWFMEDGMFYVVLSRVARLDRIAWGSDPTKHIKANPRVKDFYARLTAAEILNQK